MIIFAAAGLISCKSLLAIVLWGLHMQSLPHFHMKNTLTLESTWHFFFFFYCIGSEFLPVIVNTQTNRRWHSLAHHHHRHHHHHLTVTCVPVAVPRRPVPVSRATLDHTIYVRYSWNLQDNLHTSRTESWEAASDTASSLDLATLRIGKWEIERIPNTARSVFRL